VPRRPPKSQAYEVALDSIPDLVYVFDLGHRFVYANAALLAVWGQTSAQALGKTCLELGYPEWEARLHDREIDQVVATRKAVHGEVTFEGATGRRVWEYVFTPVLGAGGAVVAVAGTAHETTMRREYEEALSEHARRLQQADRAKDEFIATLSQELRNPLAPLRNAVSLLLRDDKVDERTLRIHRTMARLVDQLVRLVDDLFDIACVSRGDLALRREPVQLAIVIRNALETVEPILHARRHRLSVQMPSERIWVDADARRLAQVVANLIDNAARYTADGGQVEVLLEREEGGAVVRVRDNGPGLSPESRRRIFDLFDRGDLAPGVGDGGLGVGLALARRLAQLHGATLEAASEGAGRGSEFRLVIPVVVDPTLEAAVAATREAPAPT
jgi:PAS domain S-box-containing protein